MLIIKKLRLKKGWSQAELAEFSGLSIRTIQRVEKGTNPGLDTLKALAAVFNLEVADFQQEVKFMENNNVSKEEERAFKYVQGVKGFYRNLLTYLVVIIILFILNKFNSPDYLWVKWPALGWGIGIITHGVRTFELFNIFGPDWEKKQIEKRLGRKL